jgi:hypothetical protein
LPCVQRKNTPSATRSKCSASSPLRTSTVTIASRAEEKWHGSTGGFPQNVSQKCPYTIVTGCYRWIIYTYNYIYTVDIDRITQAYTYCTYPTWHQQRISMFFGSPLMTSQKRTEVFTSVTMLRIFDRTWRTW